MSTSRSTGTITLELTGPLERIVGLSEVLVRCPDDARLGQVLKEFVTNYPATGSLFGSVDRFCESQGDISPGVLVIRNAEALPARLETQVNIGERLTLMPLLSGG